MAGQDTFTGLSVGTLANQVAGASPSVIIPPGARIDIYNTSGGPNAAGGFTVKVTVRSGANSLGINLQPGGTLSFDSAGVQSVETTDNTGVLIYATVPRGNPPTFPVSVGGGVNVSQGGTQTLNASRAGILWVLYQGSAAGGALSITPSSPNVAGPLAGEAVVAASGYIVVTVPIIPGTNLKIVDAGGNGTIIAAVIV